MSLTISLLVIWFVVWKVNGKFKDLKERFKNYESFVGQSCKYQRLHNDLKNEVNRLTKRVSDLEQAKPVQKSKK